MDMQRVRFVSPVLDDTRPAVLLEDYLARLRRRNYSKMTISYYGAGLRKFLRAFDGTPLAEITTMDIERFLDSRQLSPRPWGTEAGVLKAFFQYLVEQREVVPKNPCGKIERPRWQPTPRPAPTWEDFEALCKACQGIEERVLVEVLYLTGLRAAELRALTWLDVDLDKQQILVRHGKGGKFRTVVFPHRTAELLRTFKATILRPRARTWTWDDTRPVFPGGQYLRSSRCNWYLNCTLRRLGQQVGLRYKLTCHILRHGFFRLLKTRGVPLEVAARLGGHNSISTTADIYGTLDLDDLQKSYNALVGGVMNPVVEQGITNARARGRSMTAPA